MIGDRYWTTGITLKPNDGEWAATAEFCDNGFCDDESTEGRLKTRYYVPTMAQALDLLIGDLIKLGIKLGSADMPPMIYMQGDGEDPDVDYPDGWRELLAEQAKRVQWATYGWSPTDAHDATS